MTLRMTIEHVYIFIKFQRAKTGSHKNAISLKLCFYCILTVKGCSILAHKVEFVFSFKELLNMVFKDIKN